MKKQNYLFLPIGILSVATLASGALLASDSTLAVDNATCTTTNGIRTCTSSPVTATVSVAGNVCTLTATSGNLDQSGTGATTAANVMPGNSIYAVGSTELSAQCNDLNNLHYFTAVGSSAAAGGHSGTTSLNGAYGSIPTGTTFSGDTSQWAMLVAPGSTTTIPTALGQTVNRQISGGNNFVMDGTSYVLGTYNQYTTVPSTVTNVAQFEARTAAQANTPARILPRYAIYAQPSQTAGSYTGQVTYSLAHAN